MASFVTLKARLDSHVDRATDPIYTVDRDFFVNAGIRWLQRRVLTGVGREQIFSPTLTVNVGDDSVVAPATWRPSSKTKLILIDAAGARSELVRIPYRALSEDFRDADRNEYVNLLDETTQGQPTYWCELDRTFELRPPANTGYTLEVRGLGYLADLVADADDNVLTIECEEAVLYAAIRQTWLKYEDAARVAYWGKMAMDAAQDWINDRVEASTGSRVLEMDSPGR